MRGFFHPPRDHARATMDNRMFAVQTCQFDKFDAAMLVELFRIDDRAHGIQRHGTAGITRAAAARDNRQIQLNQRAHQGRDFGFRVGIDDDKRIFDAPVGRIGNVGYPRQPVEHNIVFFRMFGQLGQNLRPLFARGFEAAVEGGHSVFRRLQKLAHLRVVVAPFLDFVQTVAHFAYQGFTAVGVFEQVVHQIRIAHHRPNIAQHFKQHPRRTPRFAPSAQIFQRLPSLFAQQSADDFPVGIRSVVVGDFADALLRGSRHGLVSVLRHLPSFCY